MLDMLAMSIACDITRVAASSFRTRAATPPSSGSDRTRSTTTCPTRSRSCTRSATWKRRPPTRSSGIAGIWNKLTAINVWYAEEVAYLAGKLNELGVLDRTAICWGNELDNGSAHDHVNHPFLIIGGCGGRLRTGQVVRYPQPKKWEPEPAGTRAHNDLLVTLAKAMGSNVQSFGDADLNAGPLDGAFDLGPVGRASSAAETAASSASSSVGSGTLAGPQRPFSHVAPPAVLALGVGLRPAERIETDRVLLESRAQRGFREPPVAEPVDGVERVFAFGKSFDLGRRPDQ